MLFDFNWDLSAYNKRFSFVVGFFLFCFFSCVIILRNSIQISSAMLKIKPSSIFILRVK